MNEPQSKVPAPLLERLLKYLPTLMVGNLLVSVPTFVISLVLAYATYVQADATRKMQQSGAWPYVSYGTSDINDEGEDEVSFVLGNDGVGPARLKQLEFRYDGKPMESPRHFLQTCCGDSRERPTPFMSSKFEVVLRPGEATQFIRLTKSPENLAVWNSLEVERWKVAVRACYCSIFDDCWVLDSRKADPEPVKSCPAGWAKFEERPSPFASPKATN